MPIGVIINTIAIFLGGIAGALLGDKLPEKYKRTAKSDIWSMFYGDGYFIDSFNEIYACGCFRSYYRNYSRISV